MNRLKKIHFTEAQYNALVQIFKTNQLEQENVDLLDCNKCPLVYQGDKHWAQVTLEDLLCENRFTIDVFSYVNGDDSISLEPYGEWIFTLIQFNSLSEIPKTYEEFIKLLDNRFMALDEEFVKEYTKE